MEGGFIYKGSSSNRQEKLWEKGKSAGQSGKVIIFYVDKRCGFVDKCQARAGFNRLVFIKRPFCQLL